MVSKMVDCAELDREIRAALAGPQDPARGELEWLARGNGELVSTLARYLLRREEPRPNDPHIASGGWGLCLRRCWAVTRQNPFDPRSELAADRARIGSFPARFPATVDELSDCFKEEPLSPAPWLWAASCEAQRIAELIDVRRLQILVPSDLQGFRRPVPSEHREQRHVVWSAVHQAVVAGIVPLTTGQMESFFDQWGLLLVDETWVDRDQAQVEELAGLLALDPAESRGGRAYFWRRAAEAWRARHRLMPAHVENILALAWS